MIKAAIITTLILLIAIVTFFIWQTKANKVPEPNYRVIKDDGAIQIREYPPLVIAQVEVEGERYSAINNGFKILADYIFGNNVTDKKITMTAPVIQEGISIPMTAPVTQEKQGDKWHVRFVMPAEFTLKTLPKPNNKRVTLLDIPAKKYIVIRFSGRNTQENLDQYQTLLIDYAVKNRLKQIGSPIYAFYNPPWILPFLRRNEIMIEIN